MAFGGKVHYGIAAAYEIADRRIAGIQAYEFQLR
jgi:hypothetical protein